jgi:hypothetical protein
MFDFSIGDFGFWAVIFPAILNLVPAIIAWRGLYLAGDQGIKAKLFLALFTFATFVGGILVTAQSNHDAINIQSKLDAIEGGVVSLQGVSPTNTTDLEKLSNQELEALVTKLTQQIRQVDVTYNNETEQALTENSQKFLDRDPSGQNNQVDENMNQIRSRYNENWQTNYKSRSLSAYNELCRRLGIDPNHAVDPNGGPAKFEEYEALSVLRTPLLAGADPLIALADYLDELVSQLKAMTD